MMRDTSGLLYTLSKYSGSTHTIFFYQNSQVTVGKIVLFPLNLKSSAIWKPAEKKKTNGWYILVSSENDYTFHVTT